MSLYKTYRDPDFSVFQSMLKEVMAESPSGAVSFDLSGATEDPMAAAAMSIGDMLEVGEPLPEGVGAVDFSGIDAGGVAKYCASNAWQLIQAKIRGDEAEIERLEEEIGQYSVCDPRWLETVEKYLVHVKLKGEKIPYRTWKNINDFMFEDRLPGNARIAIISDWGTGLPPARALLQQVARKRPHIVIHLGDIYYSGTTREMNENFLDVCREVLPRGTQLYTIPGNHDLYAGGKPFYDLLDAINQPASFFGLRNAHWQFLAMDTGLHDSDTFNVATNVTYLDEREAQWHQDKLKNNRGRKSVLLSHHQLFTAYSGTGQVNGQPQALNPLLYATFAPYLDKINLWLWGHEHNMIIFEPYKGLQRGRCVGCSAIPVPQELKPYDINHHLADPPRFNKVRLSLDASNVYNLGYAMIRLDGANGRVDYYDVSKGRPIFSELI
jgi:predicted phosphodiesterase